MFERLIRPLLGPIELFFMKFGVNYNNFYECDAITEDIYMRDSHP